MWWWNFSFLFFRLRKFSVTTENTSWSCQKCLWAEKKAQRTLSLVCKLLVPSIHYIMEMNKSWHVLSDNHDFLHRCSGEKTNCWHKSQKEECYWQDHQVKIKAKDIKQKKKKKKVIFILIIFFISMWFFIEHSKKITWYRYYSAIV